MVSLISHFIKFLTYYKGMGVPLELCAWVFDAVCIQIMLHSSNKILLINYTAKELPLGL